MDRETAKKLWKSALAAAEKHQANLKKAQFASATRNIELEAHAFEVVDRLGVAARKAMDAAVAAALQLGGAHLIPGLIAEVQGAH